MKYCVEVGSFCTRLVKRTITVYANDENEAGIKAIDKFKDKEVELPTSIDHGTPQVDSVRIANK